MENNYLLQILQLFKNITLNAIGIERDLYKLLEDGDVDKALGLFNDRDSEVDKAISEYNPQTHEVMYRPNKPRKNDRPYITEKLPRIRQRYINEVELFFLFGNPVKWHKREGNDEAFSLFKEFIKKQRFDSKTRQAKRLAGAETESAKLYHIFRDSSNKINVNSVIIARSTGYKIRTIFDQYGTLVAFAYGYILKRGGESVQCWNFETEKMLFFCEKTIIGYKVEMIPNPTGKINVVYYKQPKAWDGVEARIAREEMLDSKVADTNNYFADPIATATADVIDSLADPSKPGKLIQLMGSNSRFEYVNPPQSSELRASEKEDLKKSILFDTFTPDFSYENIKGLGSLSGAAMENSLILGFIKRENRMEIYQELIDREKAVAISILKYLHPDKLEQLESLKIDFEFAGPFSEDKTKDWNPIMSLYSAGLLSKETAVPMLGIADKPEDEINKLNQQAKSTKETKPRQ